MSERRGVFVGTVPTPKGRIDVFAEKGRVEVQATLPRESLSMDDSKVLRYFLELAEIRAVEQG